MNYLCGAPNCYSTCSTRDSIVSALLRFTVQPLPCDKCHHSHWYHFHSHFNWVQIRGPQETVDDDMRRQWEAAKDEKERIAALIALSECTLSRLSSTIDEGMDELERLMEEYACFSISDSFSGPLEKAIRRLELHCESMEEQNISPDQLEKMRYSVETMKRRLDLLKEAKENKTKGRETRRLSGP